MREDPGHDLRGHEDDDQRQAARKSPCVGVLADAVRVALVLMRGHSAFGGPS